MAINKELTNIRNAITPVNADSRLILNQIGNFFWDDSPAPSVPSGTRWRGSQAGSCARQVAYDTLGHPSSNPITAADRWRMGLGSIVHTHLEPAIKRWANSDPDLLIHEELETKIGENGYGHIDMVLELPDKEKKIVIELKTINGTGFKRSIQGEGPRHSAFLQGAMYAHALKADLLVVCYLAVELLSPGWAEAKGFDNYGRFGAEWHYLPEEFMPAAEQEINRLETVTNVAHSMGIDSVSRTFSASDPDVPMNAEVVDPSTGAWVLEQDGALISKGRVWQCNYCRYQDLCISHT